MTESLRLHDNSDNRQGDPVMRRGQFRSRFNSKENRMRRRFVSAVLLGAVFLGSVSSFAQSVCPFGLPDDVCALETKIYTNTDFKSTEDVRSVMVGLKQLLMNHVTDTNVIQDHILGLVEQVVGQAHEVRAPREILAEEVGQPDMIGVYDQLSRYESEKGPIVPLDWELPSEFMYVVLNISRTYNPVKDRTEFDWGLLCLLKTEKVVEQMQVIRYPNEVIFDRQAGIGTVSDGLIGKQKVPTFRIGSEEGASAPKEGLYLLNIKVKGKPMVNGWFVLNRTTATTNVVVRSPSPHEVMRTGNPTFQWDRYESPEFKPFNQTKRILNVYSLNGGHRGNIWWSSAVYPGLGDSVNLTNAPNETGVSDLKNGNYTFRVNFEERWFFGGLLIGRHAVTEVPFSVKK